MAKPMCQRRSHAEGLCPQLIFVLAALVLSVSLALAQNTTGQSGAPRPSNGSDAPHDAGRTAELQTRSEIRVQSNLVTAPVTVINKVTGEFVYDLKKSDFQILDNGKPQRITNFNREPHKIAAVILIQDNEAVAPLLNQVKPLAPLFSQLMLGPQGDAAVITYGSTIQVAQNFSSSEAVLDKTLQSVTSDGNKARLNDALIQAIDLLQRRPKGERRIIIVFGTGYDSGSETSKAQVIRFATNAEVEIYGLGFSLTKSYLTRDKEPMNGPLTPDNANVTMPATPGRPSTPSSSTEAFGVTVPATGAFKAAARGVPAILLANNLQTYAGYTGGVFYSQWSSTALQVHLSHIAADIHSQYLLAYVPDDLSQRGFHRLEVKVIKHGLKVRTRKGYFYEGPKQ